MSREHAICGVSATFSSIELPLRCWLAPFAHLFRHIRPLLRTFGSRHRRPGHPGPPKAQCRNDLGHPCDGPKHHFGASAEPAASFYFISAPVSMSFWHLFCKGLESRKHAICCVSDTFSRILASHWRRRRVHGSRWEAPRHILVTRGLPGRSRDSPRNLRGCPGAPAPVRETCACPSALAARTPDLW